MKAWSYGSFILDNEEDVFDANGNSKGKGPISDLADWKLFFGLSGIANKYASFSLRERVIGDRKTVATNPVGTVPWYSVTDANLILRDLLFHGVNLHLQVDNILDEQYDHPGTRTPDAGTASGAWDGDAWIGSKSWNNSLMPQPGRTVMVGLQIQLD